MITKERLQELIKQRATIYWISSGYLYPDREKIRALKLNKNFCLKDKKVGCCLVEIINGRDDIQLTINCFYETEEDAKWELEMTETRTETLKMPKWEEMTTENNEYNYYGSSVTHYFSFDNYRLIVSLEEDCEYIGIDVCGNTELYHWEDVIKENYIEACKLCLKLFNGGGNNG